MGEKTTLPSPSPLNPFFLLALFRNYFMFTFGLFYALGPDLPFKIKTFIQNVATYQVSLLLLWNNVFEPYKIM